MENTRHVLCPIRIDRSHKGWIGEPCKPKKKERHTKVKHEEMNAWEKKEGMYHRGIIVA